jgi:hypothetical protein
MLVHELSSAPSAGKTASKRLVVYTIVEKPGTDKGFWAKIGSAWVNRDQSINIQLDALPVNGKLHVREPPERPEIQPRGG